MRDAAGVLRLPGIRALVVIGAVLGMATLSDAFIYLALEESVGFRPSVFPILFVATALTYMVLAVPAGWLADRIGRGRVFAAGYALLLGVYLVLMFSGEAWWAIPLSLGLLGAFYAATDGVLMAIGSALSPEPVRGTALAVLGTATSLARLVASVAFGALWVTLGIENAIACFAGALLATLCVALLWLARGNGALASA